MKFLCGIYWGSMRELGELEGMYKGFIGEVLGMYKFGAFEGYFNMC